MKFTTANNIDHYNNVDSYTGVTDADPHQLVLMLLDGALDKIAIVKGFMLRDEVSKKGSAIGQAISIVSGLRSSLDMSAGGELAANLDNLYEYIERRLLESNMNNDVVILDEVSSLMREIKSAWVSIPLESRKKPSESLSVAS